MADSSNMIIRSMAEFYNKHEANVTNDQQSDISFSNASSALNSSRHHGQWETWISNSDLNINANSYDKLVTTSPAVISGSSISVPSGAILGIKNTGYVDEAKTSASTGVILVGLGGAHGTVGGFGIPAHGYVPLVNVSASCDQLNQIQLTSSSGNIWAYITLAWN